LSVLTGYHLDFGYKSWVWLLSLIIYPSSYHHSIIIHLQSSVELVEERDEVRSNKVYKLLEEGLKDFRMEELTKLFSSFSHFNFSL